MEKKFLFSIGILPKGIMVYDFSSVTYMNLPNGLRKFYSNSADRIFTSHFISFLNKEDALFCLNEIYRILSKNGLLRIVAPDAAILTREYLLKTESSIIEGNYTSQFRDELFQVLLGGVYHKKKIFQKRKGNLFFWDIPSMINTLKTIGFKDITVCEFKKGKDPKMASADNFPNDSFFIEAVKP